MPPRTRSVRAPNRGRPRGSRRPQQHHQEDKDIPEVYKEMLAEAETRESQVPADDRPSKRLKVAGQRPTSSHSVSVANKSIRYSVEAEEITGRQPQTVYNSPTESEESDMEWEEVDIQLPPAPPFQTAPISDADNEPLEITLGQQKDLKQRVIRRKPVTAAEKKLRLDAHKLHLLCLLSHVQRRNLWCNDEDVQRFLKQMLSKNIISLLNPPENKAQHIKSSSFIDGLNQASEAFIRRFKVTEPGLKRAHWAYDPSSLKQKMEAIIFDSEMIESKDAFRRKAMTMRGSRDFGAQLFCALLRSVAVEARLVCSLQPLPFSGTTKDMSAVKPMPQPIIISSDDHETSTDGAKKSPSSPKPSRIRRLGQPRFNPNRVRKTSTANPVPALRESSYPVYWVEAFNEAMQKWIVVDPLVTKSLAKSFKLEPPSTDPYNALSYVVAYEEDASARDVTRRYTKAFNAKTRKLRVESSKNGELWWKRALRFFEKPFLEDRDELEIGELTAKTASEPMPRNVQDFKDHPIYALERHLRRNETISPKRAIGQVSLGKSGSKGQTSEPVYRRSDVHTLRSANKWYRLGRDIKLGEQALKRIPQTRSKAISLDDSEEDDDITTDTPLYAFFQTQVYQPPPVVNGKVPKNAYGNLDVYVPSMIPPGGTYIPNPESARAARILGIDYADAVTGFNFKGRHGTAVFQGVVIASEYEEALNSVLEGLEDDRVQNKLEQKSAESLRLWKHFLLKLRIAERVNSYAVEGEDEASDEASVGPDGQSDEVEETGGGFLPESDQEMASSDNRTPLLNYEPSWRNTDPNNTHSPPDAELGGGGFFPEDEPLLTNTNDSLLPGPSNQPPVKRLKYNLVVIPSDRPCPRDLASIKPESRTKKHDTAGVGAGEGMHNPKESLGASSQGLIMVGSPAEPDKYSKSTGEPTSLDVIPADTPAAASPKPESSQPDSTYEGSLLSQDPDDEDAVPEWLMSD